MPKIHIIGAPTDLYRYETFVTTLLKHHKKWGLSISYNLEHSGNSTIIRKFKKLLSLIESSLNILASDYIYLPPMSVQPDDRLSLIQYEFARFLNKKIINEFYISLYDTFVNDRKIVSPESKRAKKLKVLDHNLHKCYRTIYLNKTEAQRYRALNNLSLEANCEIIPLSIKERTKAKLKYYSGDAGTFNMVWWGTYIPLHGLEKLIQSIARIRAFEPNIHLWILGNSTKLGEQYIRLAKSLNLSDVITIRNDLSFNNGLLEPFLIENCDLAFGSFGDSEKAKNVILNKSIEAIAMKIPVLCQENNAFKEYFNDNTIFYCANDIQSMSNTIIQIMKCNKNTIIERVNNAYEIYLRDFSINASINKFSSLLDKLFL